MGPRLIGNHISSVFSLADFIRNKGQFQHLTKANLYKASGESGILKGKEKSPDRLSPKCGAPLWVPYDSNSCCPS